MSTYLFFNWHSRPPSCPSPPPPQLLSYVLRLDMRCPFVSRHLTPAYLTIHLNFIPHFFPSLISSLFSSWDFCHNSFTLRDYSLPTFPMSKASITWSNPSPEHFQSLMPSACPTLLFLSFFYHNITTRNSMLCSSQMFSPITFLNTALTQMAINAHTYIKYILLPSLSVL